MAGIEITSDCGTGGTPIGDTIKYNPYTITASPKGFRWDGYIADDVLPPKKPINTIEDFSAWLTRTQEESFNNRNNAYDGTTEEEDGMKTIEFRVDEKRYSIEQEKGVISLKRIRQIAGLKADALLYCWDDNVAGDGQFVPAAQSYIHNAEPNLFTEAYLSD